MFGFLLIYKPKNDRKFFHLEVFQVNCANQNFSPYSVRNCLKYLLFLYWMCWLHKILDYPRCILSLRIFFISYFVFRCQKKKFWVCFLTNIYRVITDSFRGFQTIWKNKWVHNKQHWRNFFKNQKNHEKTKCRYQIGSILYRGHKYFDIFAV